MEKRFFKRDTPFRLESGKELPSLKICYHIWGNVEPNKKVIWICHALTANSNPTEWWPQMVGVGKSFDTERYTVVCANMLGSSYGSSSPATLSEKGTPYLLSFPDVTVRDIVRAHNLLREALGIEKIHLVTGASIGGFQALEWAIIYPSIIENLLAIACGSEVTPWAVAFNESQRMAIEADPTFLEQRNLSGGIKGLEAARAIALLSYRSYAGYNATQKEEEETLFAQRAASYQKYQGKKLSERFDAYCYYKLTRSIDSHNCGRGRGGAKEALGRITAKSVVVGIESDTLFPIEEQYFLADSISNAQLEVIESLFGHDGFLIESDQLKKIVEKHFKL
ncbi:MAG: homoserine O-acetyltransferase [Bacteroidales bacterium]